MLLPTNGYCHGKPPSDSLREECGVFGIWNHPDAARLAYLGLQQLQHRGQESAGIISSDGDGFFSHVASDTALRSVTFWMFGSLGRAGWDQIAVAAPLLLLPLALLPRDAQALNALL